MIRLEEGEEEEDGKLAEQEALDELTQMACDVGSR